MPVPRPKHPRRRLDARRPHLSLTATLLLAPMLLSFTPISPPPEARERVGTAAALDLEVGFLDSVRASLDGGCDATGDDPGGWHPEAVRTGAPSLGRPGIDDLCGAEDADLVLAADAEAEVVETCSGSPHEPYDVPEAEFTEAGRLPTPRGQAVHAPLHGLGDGVYARLHWDGDVSVVDRDGDLIWSVDARTLHEAWNLPFLRIPYLLYGGNPSDPFTTLSDRPFDVGDLTGDGVEDIAAAHWAPIGCPGNTSFIPHITVVDGTDGRVLWAESLAGTATQVRILDGLLLVGEQAARGAAARVHALSLEQNGDSWRVGEAWRLDTGAAPGSILDIEPAGENQALIAWTGAALGGGTSARGTIALVNTITGAVAWSVNTAGYPRSVAVDLEGGGVVAHTQSDPGQAWDVTILRLDLTNGAETARRTLEDTILLDLELSDVHPEPGVEVLTADVRIAPNASLDDDIGEGRVTALGAAGLTPLWTRSWGAPQVAFPYRLVAGEGTVAVGTYEHPAVDNVYFSRLHGLDGATGEVRWSRAESVPFPLYLGAGERNGRTVVVGSTFTQRFTVWDPATGAPLLERGLPGHVYGLEVIDVNEDGKEDLLLGFESGAVVAADGNDLKGAPTPLWELDVTHQVHELRLADLDADGAPELVVASEEAVVVANPMTGEARYTLPFPGELIWTVTVADLDADGRSDLLVPSTTLTAWRGSDGGAMWEYAPIPIGDTHFSTPAVAPDGTVAVQIVYQYPTRPVNHGIGKVTHAHHAFLRGLDGATGNLLWSADDVEKGVKTTQWRSVGYGDVDGTGKGGFLVAYRGSAPTAGATSREVKAVAIDPDTGASLGEHLSDTHAVPTGIADLGGRLMATNWYGAIRFDGAQARELEVGGPRQMGTADLGVWGPVTLVTNTQSVFAYQEDLGMWSPQDQPRPQLALAYGPPPDHRLWNGAFKVADLDGDGVDEVITHLFDYSAYLRLDTFEATFSSHTDYQAYGVAILEAPQG